jgi:LuxR family maltose regulon positive regulatory protein
MPRHENRATPKVMSGYLYTNDAYTGTLVGSPAWFAWLTSSTSFYFEGRAGTFTAHCEARRRGGRYWVAYRRQAGILHRVHLGKPELLTTQRLEQTAVRLQASSL